MIIYPGDSVLPTVGSAMTSIKHETKTDLKTKTFMPINHLGLIIAVCLCMYLSWSVFVCIHFNVSSQCPYRYDSWEGLAHPRLAARLNVILSTFCLSDIRHDKEASFEGEKHPLDDLNAHGVSKAVYVRKSSLPNSIDLRLWPGISPEHSHHLKH